MEKLTDTHCGTCAWWRALPDRQLPSDGDVGACHARPPLPDMTSKGGGRARFPWTHRVQDWCGEHATSVEETGG